VAELFNRDVAVTVGTWRVASRPEGVEDVAKPTLRMAFKVEKTNTRSVNKAELQLWNLSQQSRAAMQTKNQPVIIEAGYFGSLREIFAGTMDYGSSVRQGTDWVTTLQAGDGSYAVRSARINASLKPPGVNIRRVVETLAKSAKVGAGNLVDKFVAKSANARGGKTEFTKGVTLTGMVSDVVEEMAKTVGLEVSVQGGAYQALEPNETTEDLPVALNLESGLVGTPELGEKGVIKARSLLNGDIFPGRRLEIIARLVGGKFEINGFFKAVKVTHVGDTWGSDWYTDVEAKPL